MAIPSNEVAAEILDTLLYITIPSNPKQKINSVRESKSRTEFFDTYAILTQKWVKKLRGKEKGHNMLCLKNLKTTIYCVRGGENRI